MMSKGEKYDLKWVEEFRDVLDKFEEAIAKEDLPQCIPRPLLIRYLQVYDLDLDKGLKLLKANVKFRLSHPFLFTNRDLESSDMKKVMELTQIVGLPKRTPEDYQVFLLRIADPTIEDLDVNLGYKYLTLFQDMFSCLSPCNNGDICVYDAKGFSFRHFLKVAGSPLQTAAFMRYEQEFTALRLRQTHVVNCSPLIKRFYNLLSPFINKEQLEMIHFHSGGIESLHEFIPKDCLPKEYGGTDGSLESYSAFKDLSEMYERLSDDYKIYMAKGHQTAE